MVNKKDLTRIYHQKLETDIINQLSIKLNIEIQKAMDIYYSSKLAKQIENSEYGIDNLDYKLLVEDLIENELKPHDK